MNQKPLKRARSRIWILGAAFLIPGLAIVPVQISEAAESANTEVSSHFTPIDLTQYYDLHADESSQFGTWEVVPKGRQVYDGVPFDVNGMVRLFGRVPPPHQTIYRNEITDIQIGRRFERLHLLHGTGWTAEDGEIIANVFYNYVDGEQVSLPIIYGRHVRDWWHRDLLASGEVTDPNSRVVWVGYHGVGLRLYRTSQLNPHPEKEVQSVDIVSNRSAVTPAVLSITVGPDVDPGISDYGKNISDEDGTILFRVYDAGTEDGVAESAIHLSYRTKTAYAYWGSFATGPKGVVEVTYPAAEFEWVSATVFATGRKPQSVRWSPGKGEEIPLWHIFSVEKIQPETE